jgi:hypothetical protein
MTLLAMSMMMGAMSQQRPPEFNQNGAFTVPLGASTNNPALLRFDNIHFNSIQCDTQSGIPTRIGLLRNGNEFLPITHLPNQGSGHLQGPVEVRLTRPGDYRLAVELRQSNGQLSFSTPNNLIRGSNGNFGWDDRGQGGNDLEFMNPQLSFNAPNPLELFFQQGSLAQFGPLLFGNN